LRLAILTSAVTYAHLLFAYFFLWTVSPAWTPLPFRQPATGAPLFALLLLIASSALVGLAERANGRGQKTRFRTHLLFAMASAFIYLFLIAAWLPRHLPDTDTHAYAAVNATLYGFQAVHLIIAVMMAGFALVQSRRGLLDARRNLEARVAVEGWHYAVTLGVIAYMMASLVPYLL
jgi:cytochrome c oxidase subunit I+III